MKEIDTILRDLMNKAADDAGAAIDRVAAISPDGSFPIVLAGLMAIMGKFIAEVEHKLGHPRSHAEPTPQLSMLAALAAARYGQGLDDPLAIAKLDLQALQSTGRI